MKRLIVLFFIAASLVCQAQKGKVTGKVVDRKSGDAVEYASVVLLNPNDSSMVKGVGAVTA